MNGGRLHRQRRHPRGTALIAVLMFVVVLTIMAAAVTMTITSAIRGTALRERRAQAAALADGGLAYARAWLAAGPVAPGATREYACSTGRVEVRVVAVAPDAATVEVTGRVPHARLAAAYEVRAGLARRGDAFIVRMWSERPVRE